MLYQMSFSRKGGIIVIPKSKLLQALRDLATKRGSLPSSSYCKEYGEYDAETYKRRFGSWNNALQICFGEIIKLAADQKLEHKCEHCGTMTKNPKFCSKSCSASKNNSDFPKRTRRCFCDDCGKYMRSRKFNQSKCKKCKDREFLERFGEKKISDFSSTYARHRYQNVRLHAHRVAKLHGLERRCKICGYDKHVHLSHKKPIASFSKNTRLFVVNNIKNLGYLCPNHHWELDAGLLKF